MAEQVIIFTDGAAKGNPGPGGWGAVVCDGSRVVELGGAAPLTTNNRMEMEAAIRALEIVTESPKAITVFTDSTYLIHGITQWIHAWRRKNWRTSTGSDVLNRDLWERLDELTRPMRDGLSWSYVPGHAGVPGNERVDTIASELARGRSVDLYRGPLANYPIDLFSQAPATPPRKAMLRRNGDAPTRDTTPGKPRKGKPGKAYSYLSLIGGVAQRHATWAECEQRVRGVSGARFKKALSPEDEQRILTEWGVKSVS